MSVRALTLLVTLLTLAAPALAAFPESRPNDPLFDASPLPNATNEQWDLASPEGGFDRGISADRAWPLSTGEGTVIADIDVGIDPSHPDLAGRWVDGYDFYSRDADPASDTMNAHGINVAGVLAATADNAEGIAGVAPGARVMPIRTADNILHQGGRLAQGIVYASDHGADAISMSLGADTFSTQLRRAVRYAHGQGSVMAVASGNEFHFHHHQPQVAPEVLAVGGINPDTANTTAPSDLLAAVATDFTVHASYANRGPHLDVVAPTQVPTTEWGGGYKLNWSGTSAATPHVAAVAALVQSRGRRDGIELSADEVIQIVRQSADDLSDPGKGYAPGWDSLSGWGRVNAYEAVRRAEAGRVPPAARIASPDPYAPVRGRISVRGVAHGRSATTWELEAGAGEQPGEWRRIAAGAATGAQGARLARIDTGALGPGGWTLRLRARDAEGNVGEDRSFVTVQRDSSLRRGFPKRLGTSGEAAPTLANLSGGRGAEIVLAGSDGRVRVLSGRRARRVRGWPRAMGRTPGSRDSERRIGRVRSGFVATPAVGDIAGGRRPEVVAAGLDGTVHAWSARGRRLRGFPFRIGLRAPAERGLLDAAIYASPALADLDGNGKLDIVFGAADQRIYAVSGRGRSLPGWPVLARDGENGDVAKILSSPAVGDLNGDGSPDVVEGTAEVYGTAPSTSGRVHAYSADGKPLPGWPVAPPAIEANAIPLAGEGVPASPVLADVDGDGRDEVATAAFTGKPELYRGDGTRITRAGSSGAHFESTGRGSASRSSAPEILAIGANGAFGRTTAGGPLRFFAGAVDERLAAAQASPAAPVPFEHVVGGWDAASGSWLPGFPAPIEGWTILAGPAIADVDGNPGAELLAGSSGNVLHAWREDGSEPPGWPKPASGWLLAAPAVGDIDGDRRSEVVAVTRDGWLFAWDTPARQPATPEWSSFRHDPRNSGRYAP
jgi:subtilisin family serine protease